MYLGNPKNMESFFEKQEKPKYVQFTYMNLHNDAKAKVIFSSEKEKLVKQKRSEVTCAAADFLPALNRN